MLFSSPITLLGLGLTAAVGLWFLKPKRSLPLPPGPSGYPIIGNALDIPQTNQGPAYAEFGKRYGRISFYELAVNTFSRTGCPFRCPEQTLCRA